MRDCDYYPAGAYSDPNAPYNWVDNEDIYGDRAVELIDDEIDSHDENFIDWAIDNDWLDEDYTDEDLSVIASNQSVRDAYQEYRFSDMCEELAQEAADDYDYHCCEAAEAAREAYLMGEY